MYMSYSDQNEFFARAYRTGTDRWTNTPFSRRADELMLYLPKGAMVLDIGAGRGGLLFELQSIGFHVIGLENNPELVIRGNEEIKNKKIQNGARFIAGDALSIPLADASFDATIDIGLLHHLVPSHHNEYMKEVARVLKHEGFFFLAVLSAETEHFFNHSPKHDGTVDRNLEGVHYHFFSDEEIRALAAPYFNIRSIVHETPFGSKDVVYSIVLLKKK
jgi:ubiquinone/menaquinone biosynthesis C-methylase UbiE